MRAEGDALTRVTLVATLVVALSVSAAHADPGVFFDPGPVVVQPGEEFDLSFRVDDCGDSIASYQLYLSFDHDLIELVEATEGSLYVDSGLMTWFIEEEEEPGFWHFFDTVFGAGTHLIPPGELLHLRFRALPGAVGYTQAHVDTVRMTDMLRDPLLIGWFEHADIHIPGTGVPTDLPESSLGPGTPNPFSHGTAVTFSLSGDRVEAHIHVYDVNGRVVRAIPIPSGTRSGTIEWDGRDNDGTPTASGVYLLRMSGGGRSAYTKVLKLR